MPRGRGRRGGYQKPSDPAPVSGPGALSRRTDGGAGQPIREIPAEDHGDRQAHVALQQAAPMAADGPTATPPGAASPGGGGLPTGMDVFGPTSRPGEPITEGVPYGPGGGPPPNRLPADPDEILRAIYSVSQHPDILELLEGGAA